MNFYPYFPPLLYNFGKSWYKRFAHSGVQHFWVLWKSAQGRPYYLYRRKRNSIYTCTVKPHYILKEKNVKQSCYNATSFSETAFRPRLNVTLFNSSLTSEMFIAVNHCDWISFEVPAMYKNVMLYMLMPVSYLLDHPNLRIQNWHFHMVCKCN
jgi:hypothetical protein